MTNSLLQIFQLMKQEISCYIHIYLCDHYDIRRDREIYVNLKGQLTRKKTEVCKRTVNPINSLPRRSNSREFTS